MDKQILVGGDTNNGGVRLYAPSALGSNENLKTCWGAYAELPPPALPNGAKFFFHSGPGTLLIRWGWKAKYEA
jgi:hypothetical protein